MILELGMPEDPLQAIAGITSDRLLIDVKCSETGIDLAVRALQAAQVDR
jgi:hypothetical protein